LAGLAIIGLTLTIFGIPFALYYGGCWRFIAHVIIVEDCRVKESLMRSKELVTGHWWRLFGITLVIIICFFLVSFILNFIPFINVIASVVLAPLPIIVNTLLYLDVRVRKEGYVEETLKSDLRLAPAEVG
jgi:hypothetical protein